MAKAKKLPSGAWRCRSYDYTDSDGKIHMASFTAATKKEAEYLAAEYAVTKKQKKLPANLTIGDAIDKYILSKENVLSPGTIREYRRTSPDRGKLAICQSQSKDCPKRPWPAAAGPPMAL